MSVGTPRFGPKLDPNEHKSHMKNFEADMYRFANDGRKRDRYVNVLHLGIDLDAARIKTDRIVKFMRKRGYKVKHETGLSLSNDREMFLTGSDTDILILGSDKVRHESAYYMLRCVGAGWFWIVPYWDMLWYGTDYNPEPPTEWLKQRHMEPSALPLFSGHKFVLNAICLAHAHARRRYSRSVSSGIYINMAREIESHMNELVGWVRKDSFDAKIKKFKDKVKGDGHGGADANLFFAALDVLKHSRNVGAHLPRGIPKEVVDKDVEKSNKLMADFHMLAVDYGRMLWPPAYISGEDHGHLISKWEYGLGCMALTWLAEYPDLHAA